MPMLRLTLDSESIDNDPPITVDAHKTGEKAINLKMDSNGTIYSVAFLLDGRDVISGGREGKIRRRRAKDGQEVGAAMHVEEMFSISRYHRTEGGSCHSCVGRIEVG